jgi:phosphoribosylaminoimidazolecarboxamide formyltransferase/IMP cyclohydrolase
LLVPVAVRQDRGLPREFVSDKTGLVDSPGARGGVELVSTGGTARALARGRAAGEGRLRPDRLSRDHGRPGQDAAPAGAWRHARRRDSAEHAAAMDAHGIAPIDLVVGQPLPVRGDGRRRRVLRRLHREHRHRRPGDDPRRRQEPRRRGGGGRTADYAAILAELDARRAHDLADRQGLAAKAYARTAAYDAAMSGWFAAPAKADYRGAGCRSFAGRLRQALRYGENPHQNAGASTWTGTSARASPPRRQVQGKELSYNNINDTDAAYECVAEFDPARSAAVAIVKHANPCGVAEGGEPRRGLPPGAALRPGLGLRRHRRPQPQARRRGGGRDHKVFTEVIIAPDADEEAIAIVAAQEEPSTAARRRAARPAAPGLTVKTVAGGLLVQDRDSGMVEGEDAEASSRSGRRATPSDATSIFAFRVAKHVKSNAIVYAKGLAPRWASAPAR